MSDLVHLQDEVRGRDGAVPAMLPAVAYTSAEVLAWERRHLFAGGWTCLGRLEELLPEALDDGKRATQRALMVGDVAALLTRDGADVRMFANTCRHRAHELLPDGDATGRRSVTCPYHAWSYDLGGDLIAAPGYRDEPGFDDAAYSLVELPIEVWQGWVFGHGAHRLGDPDVVAFADWIGGLDRIVAPYDVASLVLAERHSYEIAANWKIVAENYHECYHCPLIHPELCQVTPPTSGDNYDEPGAWVGGSMVLRDGMQTMSLTGESNGVPIPGVPPTAVEYLHVLPNLLISPHPDYVMTHRLVPLAPDRTWIECSWYL
ncbi:MAG: SRPBCC family protein, partial [Nocardioides sp.]